MKFTPEEINAIGDALAFVAYQMIVQEDSGLATLPSHATYCCTPSRLEHIRSAAEKTSVFSIHKR